MILPLEQQVASIDLCRRLKDLGAPQDSEFRWFHDCALYSYQSLALEYETNGSRPGYGWHEGMAAYTVAELGAMLPGDLVTRREGSLFRAWLMHWERDTLAVDLNAAGATEAEARAGLLIALAERGIVTWPAP